jgi:hypothetical protein
MYERYYKLRIFKSGERQFLPIRLHEMSATQTRPILVTIYNTIYNTNYNTTGSAAMCGSAGMCGIAAVCASVCGSATVCGSAAVRLRQCAR